MTETIPYSPEKVDILARVLNHDVAHVKEAIRMAVELELITILDSGMWMSQMQNFIGQSSTEADRIRSYRRKLKCLPEGKKDNPYICTPEKEKEKEIEKEFEVPSKRTKVLNKEERVTEEFEAICQKIIDSGEIHNYRFHLTGEDKSNLNNYFKVNPELICEVAEQYILSRTNSPAGDLKFLFDKDGERFKCIIDELKKKASAPPPRILNVCSVCGKGLQADCCINKECSEFWNKEEDQQLALIEFEKMKENIKAVFTDKQQAEQ